MTAWDAMRKHESGRGHRLTRERVLHAALDYVDEHGLAALSMDKLGTELGVRGVSLYNHVASKEALLDGIVEIMWSEAELEPTDEMKWPDAIRSCAATLRSLVHSHPGAARLIIRSVLPTHALEKLDSWRLALIRGGLSAEQALRALRAVAGYALGCSVLEVTWGDCSTADSPPDELRMLRRVSAMVAQTAPDHLVRLAVDLCGGRDPDQDFNFGIELLISGLHADQA